jgi:broad specificity phosphatase PhoE
MTRADMELIIVRHGETPFNRERKVQGITDLELNATGLHQARQLALALKGHKIHIIYSSPLKRAYTTAKVINEFHDVPLHTRAGLMEMDQGDFEGLSFQELMACEKDFLQRWIAEPAVTRMPNGECFKDVQERAWKEMEDIITRAENALIVSHNFTIAAILCKIKRVHLSQFRKSCVETASKTIVRFTNGIGEISLFNDRSHLDHKAHTET